MICKICSIDKAETEFHFRKDSGKFRTECKICFRQKNKIRWNLNNKELNEKRREKRDESTRERERKWLNENRGRKNSQARERRARNPELFRDKEKERYSNNPEIKKISAKKYYTKARKERLEYRRQYAAANRGKCNFLSQLRNKRKIKATPDWLSSEQKEEMRNIYIECARLSEESGIEHNVDHIIPLRSDLVCGLHVPWNLQILTKEENSKKSNKILEEYLKGLK